MAAVRACDESLESCARRTSVPGGGGSGSAAATVAARVSSSCSGASGFGATRSSAGAAGGAAGSSSVVGAAASGLNSSALKLSWLIDLLSGMPGILNSPALTLRLLAPPAGRGQKLGADALSMPAAHPSNASLIDGTAPSSPPATVAAAWRSASKQLISRGGSAPSLARPSAGGGGTRTWLRSNGESCVKGVLLAANGERLGVLSRAAKQAKRDMAALQRGA